jgi:hypothetical protein
MLKEGNMAYQFILLISVGFIIVGCTSNSIHHKFYPGGEGTQSISIDAKQRVIIATRNMPPNGDGRVFVCAEPSPDALSAIATSMGKPLGSG